MTTQLKRIGGLKGILEVATQHPVVQQIIVIWNGPDIPAEVSELERHPERSARITVIHREVNSLNNRYDPLLPVHTGAVMILDDDLVISKETIDCAFGAWKRDPSQLYSFGRGRSVSAEGHEGYRGLPVGDAATNFLLPRMVFHRKFMALYFDATNQALRDYVDKQEAHCDDIAFASVVTKYNRKPIKYVPAPCQNTGESGAGLSNVPNRRESRNDCAKHIVAMLNWTMMAVETVQC